MAQALRPAWYSSLCWPVANVVAAITSASKDKRSETSHGAEKAFPVPPPSAVCSLSEHAIACVGSTRSFVMALFCVYVLHGGTDPDFGYPAFGRAANLEASWMLPILVRNIIATWLIAGLWDWFLYFSPLSPHLKKYKMNQTYPSFLQIRHDALFTTLASVCGSVIEITICHGYATGWWDVMDTVSLTTWLQGIATMHWRIPHFYVIHRAMHPWKLRGVSMRFDPGYHLYRHVHSLHHKSCNPTAFSGTNMHPVEATLYYSAAFIPLLLFPGQCHPAVPLGCIIDCGVGAWLGHDGFQWPGAGDYYHILHHEHFDCNYGTQHVPLDYWFGTFAANKHDVKTIWRGCPM